MIFTIFNNKLTLQWKSISRTINTGTSAENIDYNFPIAFTSKVVAVTIGKKEFAGVWVGLAVPNKSQLTLSYTNTGTNNRTINTYIIAIGY